MAKDKPKNKGDGEGVFGWSRNSWIIVSAVLAVIVVVLLIINFNSSCPTGNVVSKEEAGEELLGFVQSQGMEAEVSGVEEESGLYKVNLEIQGQEQPIHVTKDGENLVQGIVSFEDIENQQESTNEESSSTDIPKSENPNVELFVMSYCPYGTQAQKGIIPAVKALGDSVDFKVRFVNYLMHGEKEGWENTRQYCIQKEQGDKLNAYLTCFLDEGKSEECLDEVGIDKDKLDGCVDGADEEYNITGLINDQSSYRGGRFPQYNVNDDLNNEYGVGGSPTLIINGKKVQSGRSPAAYLDTICSAFTDDAKPSECEEANLTTETYSPNFGYDVSTSGNAGGQC